ncbi:MAG: oligosaccharide flippase family protein [Roseateles sp.]
MNLRRSLLVSLLSRYVLLIVNLLVSVVVARLLTPAEMGAFSLCMVLLSFAAIFRDFGASTYLMQVPELNAQRLRATMGLQLLIGAALALGVALASTPLAAFYREPGLRELMLWVALSYLVSPLGTVTQALLQRNMRFDAIASIQIGAGLAAAAVTVGLAWAGWGARSLAIGQLASVLASVLLSQRHRPEGLPWMPSLRGVREILHFGGAITGIAIVNVAVKGAPELLLGKLQGLHSVGLFARGQGMVVMFGRQMAEAVSAVALPNFSRMVREGGNLGEAFLRGTAYVTAVAWSICLGMAVLADPLIRVLYGAQWLEAIPLVRWVAASYGAGLSVMLASAALTGMGAVRALGWATLVSGVLTIAAVAIGALFSLEAVGMGLFVAGVAHTGIFFALVRWRLGFAASRLAATLARSGAVAVCAALPALAVVLAPKPAMGGAFIELLAGGLLGALGFVAGVLWARHPLRQEFSLVLGKLGRWRPRSGPPAK